MIETRQLTKRYGDLTAVDNISFKVEPGQVLGFLGPNGAGKSTTMKMIAGFLAPTSGGASVCGYDVSEQSLQAKAALGYLPEGAPSYGEMTPREFLAFIADMRALSGKHRSQRIDDVIERLHLNAVLAQPIETLSKGFKRRVGLAQAIIHDPAVLILDEPTDGLDPNQKHEVRSLINAMAKDKTIVVSTHILEEVHAVCTRAIIIAQGKVLADATPAELEARSRYYQAVSLTTTNVAAAKEAMSRVGDVAAVEIDPQDHRLTAFPKPGKQIFGPISDLLKAQGIPVSELQLESGRMDEVFRTITQGEGTEAHA
jgi:ABC-2 type transport system ATP-binding protein